MTTTSKINAASLETLADWHVTGLFAVITPEGEILLDTFETTAYSTRATFIHKHNKRWSVSAAEGFIMGSFMLTGQVIEKRAPSR